MHEEQGAVAVSPVSAAAWPKRQGNGVGVCSGVGVVTLCVTKPASHVCFYDCVVVFGTVCYVWSRRVVLCLCRAERRGKWQGMSLL